MKLLPPKEIRQKAKGGQKRPHRNPPESPVRSTERKVPRRIALPLLRCWPPGWVSEAGAEAVAKGAHASELVQRWRRELCPQSKPLNSPGKTRESASGASLRPARCTSLRRPAEA